MNMHIVPECYFDTVLVKAILDIHKVNHKKGCPNVIKEISDQKYLNEDFAVGVIDKDKKELDYIKNECREEIRKENLILLKHKTKKHYFIQLIPAIEKWIINASVEGGINISNFGFPDDVTALRKFTKSGLVSENKKLRDFCEALIDSDSTSVNILSKWLKYLYEKNRNADINEMKKWD